MRRLVLGLLMVPALLPLDAEAAYPGENGKIAYVVLDDDFLDGQIWTMNPDGTGRTQLTSGPDDSLPVFTNTSQSESTPTWSPDGSRIGFTQDFNGIFSVRPDGSDRRTIAAPSSLFPTFDPDWAPYNTRMLFSHFADCDGDFETLFLTKSADGAGSASNVWYPGCGWLTTSSAASWAPDASRLVFELDGEIRTVGIDGTGLSSTGVLGNTPDWQPLPVDTPSAFARPLSANRVQFSLVPAFNACTSPNREHGPSLAFGSCAPPQPGSPNLAVSAGESRLRSSGFVRLKVSPGAPGGVDDTTARVRLNLTNVMRTSDLSDYSGELRGSVRVRLTDRVGLSGSPSQTVQNSRSSGRSRAWRRHRPWMARPATWAPTSTRSSRVPPPSARARSGSWSEGLRRRTGRGRRHRERQLAARRAGGVRSLTPLAPRPFASAHSRGCE